MSDILVVARQWLKANDKLTCHLSPTISLIRRFMIEHKALREENERLKAEIDAAWFNIEHGWDIESRAELESQARTNGFKFGLAQAVCHMWKRELKDNPPFSSNQENP